MVKFNDIELRRFTVRVWIRIRISVKVVIDRAAAQGTPHHLRVKISHYPYSMWVMSFEMLSVRFVV